MHSSKKIQHIRRSSILPQLGFRVYIMMIVLFEQLILTLQGYFELYKLKISSFQGKNNLKIYLE
jgi:hypothetical protein